MKRVFFILAVINCIFLTLTYFYLPESVVLGSLEKTKFIFHEHFSLSHRNLKHYTLPNTPLLTNTSNVSSSILFFPNNSRGIVNCSHFESELRCDEIEFASNAINATLLSKRFLILELPNNYQSAINSLHFGFLLSIITKRRLFVLGVKFNLPEVFQVPAKLQNKKFFTFTPSSFNKCDPSPILNSKLRGFKITGNWDISQLLLSPISYSLIPFPFKTHSFFLMSRWMFNIQPMNFPSDQLQIGISLEFQPDQAALLHVIERITEGYSKWVVHIWQPKKFSLPKELKKNVRFIKKFDDALNVLPQCDKFIGSLGYFSSHVLCRTRGRGGVWLDPRNTMIMETSNSQSGMMFLMKKEKVNEIMCPGGADALQSFLMFQAL